MQRLFLESKKRHPLSFCLETEQIFCDITNTALAASRRAEEGGAPHYVLWGKFIDSQSCRTELEGEFPGVQETLADGLCHLRRVTCQQPSCIKDTRRGQMQLLQLLQVSHKGQYKLRVTQGMSKNSCSSHRAGWEPWIPVHGHLPCCPSPGHWDSAGGHHALTHSSVPLGEEQLPPTTGRAFPSADGIENKLHTG